MNEYFKQKLLKEPDEINNDVYYYHTDDGDQFDEDSASSWQEKYFKLNWEHGEQVTKSRDTILHEICEMIAKEGFPFMEIACGPGMGLAPSIIAKNPEIECLATDACSLLIKNWKQYYDQYLTKYHINFAQFSVMDIPMKTNSIHTVTSYIGISSTRNGEAGRERAISEIFRILKPGGHLYAIENEWTDIDAINRVFQLWGKETWFKEKETKSWHTRFIDAGFQITYEKLQVHRNLTENDNDLGAMAHRFGIEIGMNFTAFILQKPL